MTTGLIPPSSGIRFDTLEIIPKQHCAFTERELLQPGTRSDAGRTMNSFQLSTLAKYRSNGYSPLIFCCQRRRPLFDGAHWETSLVGFMSCNLSIGGFGACARYVDEWNFSTPHCRCIATGAAYLLHLIGPSIVFISSGFSERSGNFQLDRTDKRCRWLSVEEYAQSQTNMSRPVGRVRRLNSCGLLSRNVGRLRVIEEFSLSGG